MGCFFSCLRINDGSHSQIHLVTDSVSGKPKERGRSPRSLKNHRHTEAKIHSPYKDKENSLSSFLQQGNDDEMDLKAEAGSLKALFTSVESQNEVGKELYKHKDSLLATPDSKPPLTPIQVSEKWLKQTERGTLGRQIPGVNADSSIGESEAAKENPTDLLISTEDTVTDKISKNKSVHFKYEDDTGSVSSRMENQKFSDAESCPTPFNLTDEMQTPGTAFPTNLDEFGMVKNPRIRSQYVYPVVTCGREDHHQVSELSSDTELKVEESLSDWFKPLSTNPGKRDYIGISHGDRPIIGMVAAHWTTEDESCEIPAKPWDGKGIPNSTTKYKEDQKIYYHATPFEERLEKALSDETLVSRKKIVKQMLPVNFEESEESDTAMSQLQSSSRQPVASF
ncbi:protein JASON-like isoform X2 [Impatiens glandulifera]|uniref:protein JASON-like isoform X2 n=1 Tax=Impatiens glandulifera TaxID=253017 RepID=UPI001FB0A720|nr:protein JASON-like isoform X2 [Impatiens glandulifera]